MKRSELYKLSEKVLSTLSNIELVGVIEYILDNDDFIEYLYDRGIEFKDDGYWYNEGHGETEIILEIYHHIDGFLKERRKKWTNNEKI